MGYNRVCGGELGVTVMSGNVTGMSGRVTGMSDVVVTLPSSRSRTAVMRNRRVPRDKENTPTTDAISGTRITILSSLASGSVILACWSNHRMGNIISGTFLYNLDRQQ